MHFGNHQTQHNLPVKRGDAPATFRVGEYCVQFCSPQHEKDVKVLGSIQRMATELVIGLKSDLVRRGWRCTGLSSLEEAERYLTPPLPEKEKHREVLGSAPQNGTNVGSRSKTKGQSERTVIPLKTGHPLICGVGISHLGLNEGWQWNVSEGRMRICTLTWVLITQIQEQQGRAAEFGSS